MRRLLVSNPHSPRHRSPSRLASRRSVAGGGVEYFQGLITPLKTTHKQKNSRAFVAKHTKLTQQGTAKFSLLILSIQ